jgi:hypothetical protein
MVEHAFLVGYYHPLGWGPGHRKLVEQPTACITLVPLPSPHFCRIRTMATGLLGALVSGVAGGGKENGGYYIGEG